MNDVYLDGEKVEFAGTPPRSPGEAWAFIERYLDTVNRVVAEASLDGQDWAPDAACDTSGWGRLEMRSDSMESRLRQLAETWLEAGERSAAERTRELARVVLRSAWDDAQAATVAAFEELQPLVEGVGLLIGYGQRVSSPWAPELMERFGICSAALDAAVGCVQARDGLALAEVLGNRLALAFDALLAVVGREFLGKEDCGGGLSEVQLGELWVQGLRIPEYCALAVTGVGDGRHLQCLAAALPVGCYVFCGDSDAEAFERFRRSPIGGELLRDSRFFWGLGPVADETFFRSMDRFPVLEVQDAQTLIFGPSYNARPEFFNAFFLEFARKMDFWRSLFGTNAMAAGDWQENTLANARLLIGAPDLAAFKGAFAGAEMVLVSAGPSLDASLEHLRSIGDNAVLVAVNSSFRALRNAGIDPHFVIAADPYEWTDRGFQGVDLGRTILICPFIVYPDVVRRFAGRIVTWSENNLLASYFRLKLGLGRGSYVVEQGTVSACAFDIAETFGCARLTLVGQDLAIAPTGQSHASDTFYADIKANQAVLGECRWLPGNTMETVPVEKKLLIYLRTFEQLARERGHRIELRNTARLGAAIEGVPYVEIETVASEWAGGSSSQFIGSEWERVRERCAPRHLDREIVAELESFRDFVRGVTGLALRSAIRLETVDVATADVALDAARMRAELDAELARGGDYYALLKDGQLKYELLRCGREIRALSKDLPADERRVNEETAYFWAVAEGGFALSKSIERALESGNPSEASARNSPAQG